MIHFFKIMSDNTKEENSQNDEKKEEKKEKESTLKEDQKEKECLPNSEETENNIQDFYRCPICNEIPFIKINKSNYTITTECNNNHIFQDISVEQFISDLKKANLKFNNQEKNKSNDSICNIHKEKYINYCKTCKINLCMYCDYNLHESHDIKFFFPIISELETKIAETKLKLEFQNQFIDSIEKWRKEFNDKILAFETFLKNSLLLIKYNTINIDIKNINYQIIHNYYELSEYKGDNFPIFKEFSSANNFMRKGNILLKILNFYENNCNTKKENKLINNIEVKSTITQSAYPFNYFKLIDENYEDNIIGLINDETIRLYSISKNNVDFEMHEKLIINEQKNINYLTTIEINNYKNFIISCVDNLIKIIKIIIEENNIIGYEEKKIFNLNNMVKKVLSDGNRFFACDKSKIVIYQNNIEKNINNNEGDWYDYKQIDEIKSEQGNYIYDIIFVSEKEIASIQKNEKNEDKIFLFFYSTNDYKSIKNIEISIKNNLKENENGIISSYSSLMINDDILGIILKNYLFLISTKNKELINSIAFDGELYFIEKFTNDSFILNRKIEDKKENNTNKKLSILFQYKLGEKNELVELGENKEMMNLSEFNYFPEFNLAMSTSYDYNIISVWS